MLINEELGKSGRSFGEYPDWMEELTGHPAILENTYKGSVRLTTRTHDGLNYFCFEDNMRMLRLLLREADGVFEAIYFSMPVPVRTRPVRPPWGVSHIHRFGINEIDTLRTELIDFFSTFPSSYPLSAALKISVNDDPRVMINDRSKKTDNPVYFCGKVVEVFVDGPTERRVIAEGASGGKVTRNEITITTGRYYGKNPHPGDWVIFKHDHLTAVVSKRELKRYYGYVDVDFNVD
jgi:hypothetical protein